MVIHYTESVIQTLYYRLYTYNLTFPSGIENFPNKMVNFPSQNETFYRKILNFWKSLDFDNPRLIWEILFNLEMP